MAWVLRLSMIEQDEGKRIDKWIGMKPGVWGRSPQLADDPGVAKVPSAASAPWQRHGLVS